MIIIIVCLNIYHFTNTFDVQIKKKKWKEQQKNEYMAIKHLKHRLFTQITLAAVLFIYIICFFFPDSESKKKKDCVGRLLWMELMCVFFVFFVVCFCCFDYFVVVGNLSPSYDPLWNPTPYLFPFHGINICRSLGWLRLMTS